MSDEKVKMCSWHTCQKLAPDNDTLCPDHRKTQEELFPEYYQPLARHDGDGGK